MLSTSLLVPFVFLFASCEISSSDYNATTDSQTLHYGILKTLPHNTAAFTEGLVIYNGKVLEGTGLNNQSWIAEVDLLSGDHNKKVLLSKEYFGEGITVLNKKIYQLTYQEKVGFIYDVYTYNKIGEFNYNTEGWGLTHDDKNLIMSDGSHKLYFLDTTTLQVIRTLPVTDPGHGRVKNLNELEYINGFIFANVHESSLIVKIDPANGNVAGRLDLTSLTNEIKRMTPRASELNGIAYDRDANTMLVTGKFWPKAYVIKIQ
jgi:glutamine cyclotransferase